MTRLLSVATQDAWRRWTSDRGVIVAIAGPFIFLPLFAWLLLVTEPTAPPGASDQDKLSIALAWAGQHAHWLALRLGLTLFATAAILGLFLARDHRDVRALLARSLRALPLFAVAVLVSWGLVMTGVFLFIVPGLYIYGRVALTGPVLIAEPGVGVSGAVTRSIALTHGNGWRIFALLTVPLLIEAVALQVIGSFDVALRGGAGIDPVAAAVLAAVAALFVTTTRVARMLLQVSLYRRLATPRHGV